MTLTDEDRALTYEEAERLALLAIHDVDGRGMVGRGRNHLHQRVARALLSAARQASTQGPGEGWQPIETAPTDGTSIILFCPQGDGSPGSTYRITEGFWLSDPGGTTEYRDQWGRYEGQTDQPGFDGWMSMDGGFSEDTMMPTHWRPFPNPPPGVEKANG